MVDKRYIPEDVWNYIKSFVLYPTTTWYHIMRTRSLLMYHKPSIDVRNYIFRNFNTFLGTDQNELPTPQKLRLLEIILLE